MSRAAKWAMPHRVMTAPGGCGRVSEGGMMVEDVVILSGVRTAIGDFGGALKDVPPATLGKIVIEGWGR